jgi:predicted Ser/Thr protein kinase
MNLYNNKKIIKYFSRGTSGTTCLLEGNIVKKVYTNDIDRRMFKEIRALKLLHNHNHFPKILHIDNNIVYMQYVGISIKYSKILPIDYEQQIDEIIYSLKKCDIFHQDIILDHITFFDNVLYLIDFEKSMTKEELNKARILQLPEWKILKYYDVNYIKKIVESIAKNQKTNTTQISYSYQINYL